ncbi:5876_t:CDS:2 [Funneliformis geosporum]|nr:5876_t:CDS:2 [Funneliformis geosporum]
MDSELMKHYDSFREHLKESVKQKFTDCEFDLATIPVKLGDIYGCVKRSCEGISIKIIIDSFKTCDISNMLDDIGDSDKEIEGDLEITNISDLENDISNFENDVHNDNLKDN